MSLAEPNVFVTEHDDGSADFTISIDEDNHQFSASVSGADDSTAVLSYEESLLWRGQIVVSEPREEVWKLVMQSQEMTRYLERNSLSGVRRERR